MQLTMKNRIRDPVQLELAADLCKKSKQLYNFSNYIIRQAYFESGDVLSYVDLYHLVKDSKDSNGDVVYRRLPTAVSQQVLKQLSSNWKAYLRATKEYKNSPGKFKGRPKPPGYVKHFNVVSFDRSRCLHVHQNQIHFCKSVLKPVPDLSDKHVKLIRLVPHHDTCDIEYVYDVDEKTHTVGYTLAIDPGLNNLITAVDTAGNNPFIINGRIIKSINQQYNKQKSKLQSQLPNKVKTSALISRISRNRDNRIKDQLHKVTRSIINYCISNSITNIIFGSNQYQKQKINLGVNTNQQFVSVPFYKLKQILEYKCKLEGISFILQEESYTSKCSYLDDEEVCKHDTYLGKRISRGVFRSSNGTLINSDVNAAYNILRKYTGEVADVNVKIYPYKYTVGSNRII